MSVTLDTSHFEMSSLNTKPVNMLFMFLTFDTSHFEISPTNAPAFLNIPYISIHILFGAITFWR